MDIYLANYSEISYKAFELFRDIYFQKIREKGRISVVVCGGRGPKGLYELLNKSNFIDFSKVDFFISDERITDDKEEINYLYIEKILFKDKINYNFFKINPLSKNAAFEYNDLVFNFLRKNKFDLLILGIGSDGHVASLFRKDYPQYEYVIKTKTPEGYKTRERITLNYISLNSSQFCMFFVSGEGKRDIKEKILNNDISSYPFSLISVRSKFFIEKNL